MRAAIVFFGAIAIMNAQTVDRTKPPRTPAAPDYKLPPMFETKLPNGLSVILVQDSRFPLVTVRLGFLAGSRFDPADLPGLAESTAALLTQGTRTRSQRQIAEEVAEIGGQLNGGAGADSITLSGSALAEHAGKLLELLADVARNPTFPENEVKLRIQNRKQELEAQRSQPAFLAEEALNRLVFGQSGYAHIAPTRDSLDRMNRQTFAKFHDTYVVPNNGYLVLLGKLPGREATLRLIRQHFGSWQRKELPAAPKLDLPASQRALQVVDRPGSVQADIHVGRIAITRADPEFFPLMVGQFILGGGASSRMFMNIREKQGFAYDAHAELNPRRDTGFLAAVTQVRNEVLQPAMQALLDELTSMVKAKVPEAELERTKNFLNGIYVMRLETQSGLATQLITLKLMGLPNSYLEQYTARVKAVTPEQIQQAAARYMNPQTASMVVVGDASKIVTPLEKFGKVAVTKAQ